LAEVLITLAIIGVVAAITIPSIIANHKKRTLETQFTKAYRTLSQAVSLAVAEHGDISVWDWKEDKTYSNEEKDAFVKKYFLPYLNVAKFCPSDNSVKGCATDKGYKAFASGGNTINFAKSNHPKILLTDGTFAYFKFTSTTAAQYEIYVDINGQKNPNTIGQDLFVFQLYKETGEFLPCGIINNSVPFNEEKQNFTYYSKGGIDQACTKSYGYTCAAKIVLEGFKMNY